MPVTQPSIYLYLKWLSSFPDFFFLFFHCLSPFHFTECLSLSVISLFSLSSLMYIPTIFAFHVSVCYNNSLYVRYDLFQLEIRVFVFS